MVNKLLIFLAIILGLIAIPSVAGANFISANQAAKESRERTAEIERNKHADFLKYAENTITDSVTSGGNSAIIVADDDEVKYLPELTAKLNNLGYTVKKVTRTELTRLEVSW